MKKLKDICMVDWQLCSFRSPVLDIFIAIFSATDKSFRDKEYANLLEHYHKSVSNMIRKLGSDPDKLFSREQFQKELKKFGKFNFLMAPMWTQFRCLNLSNVPDIDEVIDDFVKIEKDADFYMEYDQTAQLEYKQAIDEIFGELIALGYYWN